MRETEQTDSGNLGHAPTSAMRQVVMATHGLTPRLGDRIQPASPRGKITMTASLQSKAQMANRSNVRLIILHGRIWQ